MSDTPRNYELDANAEIARLRDKVETLMTERVTPSGAKGPPVPRDGPTADPSPCSG